MKKIQIAIYSLVLLAWTAQAEILQYAPGGGSSVTFPSSGQALISSGPSGNPTGIAPVNGSCLVGAAGSWAVGSCSGSGGISGPGSSTNNYVPQWNGTGGTALSAGLPVGTTGNSTILESNSSGYLASGVMPAFTGDCTTSAGSVATTCTKTNGSAFGSLATLNAAPANTLTGTTLASGVTASSLTSLGTITSGIWQGTAIANTYLANSATTVNGQTCTLGSSCTAPAAYSTLTGTAAQGNILYYNGSAWAVLAPGTSGYVLQTQGAGANPQWAAAGGSVSWPTSGNIVISNGTNTPASLAPVNGDCVVGSGGVWTAGSCAGGGGSVNSVTGDSYLISNSASTGTVTLTQANHTANTVAGALTATTLSDLSVPSCSTAGSALKWTSGTGFGCNSSITASAVTGQTFPGSGIIVGTTDTQTLTNKSIAGSEINSGTVGSAYGGAGTITGALKGNGSGVVSQAACADLSNGASGCSTATGTSGATIPLLNAANTWSNVQTHNSGDLSLAGSSTGSVLLNAPATASGTDVLPATAGTLVGSNDTGTVTNAMLAGSIAASKITTGTSGANIPLLNGSNTDSGNNTHSGTNLFTGGLPTLANGDASVAASSTLGGIYTGQGSTNDITFENKSGTSVCAVATGTTTLNCTGLQVGGTSVLTSGNAFTLTTTGTSGAATYAGGTLNIPQYSGGGGGVTSFTGISGFSSTSGATGAVTETAANATAKSLWGNTSSSSGPPSYVTSPVLSGSVTATFFNATTAGTGYEIAGSKAFYYPTSDTSSTLFIGQSAGSGETSTAGTFYNTGVGQDVFNGTMTTAAINNSAFGAQALLSTTSGHDNTGVGFSAGYNVTSGNYNTIIGSQSSIASGAYSQNTIVGSETGSTNVASSNNTVIGGSLAGSNLGTGGNNLIVGAGGNCDVSALNASNEAHVCGSAGDIIKVTGTNTQSTEIFTVNGNIIFPNVTTGTNTDFVCMSTGGKLTLQTSACTISQRKLKENIAEIDGQTAVNDIMALKPVAFNMKHTTPENPDKNHTRAQYGFIAEDVAAVDPHLSIFEDDMITPKTYRQEAIISLLTKTAQEQQKEIEALKAENAAKSGAFPFHKCFFGLLVCNGVN